MKELKFPIRNNSPLLGVLFVTLMMLGLFIGLMLYSNSAFAEFGRATFQELKFLPTEVMKNNKIEWAGQPPSDRLFQYSTSECYPLKLIERQGYKFYSASDESRAVKYIDYIRDLTRGRHARVDLKLNGKHIYGKRLQFRMIEDCQTLVPTHFIAGEDQNYFGVPIKKGNEVIEHDYHNEKTFDYIKYGPIDDDGYLSSSGKIVNSTVKDDLAAEIKDLYERYKDYNNAKKPHSVSVSCTKVLDSAGSKNGFYIYGGKRVEFQKLQPKFWLANSKYLGHRLCSDRPDSLAECEGTIIGGLDAGLYIFGLEESRLESLEEANPDLVKEIKDTQAKAKVLGKKCDEVIAKHEKETGKKVKISPFYPEELLQQSLSKEK